MQEVSLEHLKALSPSRRKRLPKNTRWHQSCWGRRNVLDDMVGAPRSSQVWRQFSLRPLQISWPKTSFFSSQASLSWVFVTWNPATVWVTKLEEITHTQCQPQSKHSKPRVIVFVDVILAKLGSKQLHPKPCDPIAIIYSLPILCMDPAPY